MRRGRGFDTAATTATQEEKEELTMRITVLVFATLLLLATSAAGFLGAWRGLKDAKDMDALLGEDAAAVASAAEGSDAAGAGGLAVLAGSTGKLRAGAVVFGITGLVALGLLVLTFLNRFVPYLALGIVVLALVGTFLSPQYDLGPLGPASARQLGYVISVLAALGGASAMGAWALKRRRALQTAPAQA
jgi:hypothetical protein